MRVRALILLGLFAPTAFADEAVTIAVASNFSRTAAELVTEFQDQTGVDTRYTTGSTGKLYHQILHGAPYNVFLAADAERPVLLEQSGRTVPTTRFTYAIGALVLWSPEIEECREALGQSRFNHLSIANPQTAPYGRAAREFLVSAGLWERVAARTVNGENIIQALQFVATGNADLGLVARSQLTGTDQAGVGCQWPVPASSHASLDQQVVVLKPVHDGALRFAEFLRSEKARAIIRRHGYGVAE